MTDFGTRPADMLKSVYDADEDGIVDDSESTAAHATKHQYGGSDEIDATLLVGRVNYVDRGDPVANDFVETDLTTDATYRDLDLSSIIPANTKLVLLRIMITDNSVSSMLSFRKNGNSGGYNIARVRTQISGVSNDANLLVSPDSNGVIEYHASNVAWDSIKIVVRGWFV